MERQPAVYIVTNKRNGVLYIGVTSNLWQRIFQHRDGLIGRFTKKYNCHHLVYFELAESMETAINREKQLKGWLRMRKIALIESTNPEWIDLFETVCG